MYVCVYNILVEFVCMYIIFVVCVCLSVDLHFVCAKVSTINNYAHEIRSADHKLGEPTLKVSPLC